MQTDIFSLLQSLIKMILEYYLILVEIGFAVLLGGRLNRLRSKEWGNTYGCENKSPIVYAPGHRPVFILCHKWFCGTLGQ